MDFPKGWDDAHDQGEGPREPGAAREPDGALAAGRRADGQNVRVRGSGDLGASVGTAVAVYCLRKARAVQTL